jgi:transcriptional regulator with XRE-family HTH domain
MELQQVRNALNDRIIAKVAEATGLNPHTIYRIKKGKANPNKSTLKLLSNYLKENHAD